MRVYQSNEIKNFVLLGNAGSGKTTLAEAMLLAGGVISRRGEVSSKNTVSDYREIEQAQGGSVFATVLYSEWKDKKLNFIDAPGLDDFCNGGITGLNIMDLGVIVINAQNGVEVGTEIMFRHAKRLEKPVLFVLNHIDHEKANFDKAYEDARQTFGKKVILAQYPVNTGAEFNSIIDLVLMKMLKFKPEGGLPEIVDIPASEQDKAEELRGVLIEAAAENDEALMEKFFETGALTEEEMFKGIEAGLLNRSMFPVFCVSAKKDIGVRRLMDFIAQCAPKPTESKGLLTKDGKEIKYDAKAPLSIFIFKNAVEQHIGEVLYFKVLTGSVDEGADINNINKQSKERLGQLFVAAGKNRVKINKLVAGDIGSTVKLRDTKRFHTLGAKEIDYQIAPLVYPKPKYRTAIKAKNEADEEKLAEVLNKMRQEDPTILLEYSKELRQSILQGQGEFHINTIKWHLDNLHKIEVEFFAPKIPYRETITKNAFEGYRHKKQSGGAGQFGEVHLFIEPHEDGKPNTTQVKTGEKVQNLQVRDSQEIPLAWGGKLIYNNCIVGGVIDARFMPAILKGIMEKIEQGPLTGSYARDIRVYVYDGKMHPVDSNEISFKLAGMNAFKAAFKKAGPKIMEPIYQVEVLVPADKMGDVMSDLQNRRALILGQESESGYEKLNARVPLAEMNRYSTTLSSLTSGRATYSMEFLEYKEVPREVQETLLKAYEAVEVEE